LYPKTVSRLFRLRRNDGQEEGEQQPKRTPNHGRRYHAGKEQVKSPFLLLLACSTLVASY
jgi:hypothetical protein